MATRWVNSIQFGPDGTSAKSPTRIGITDEVGNNDIHLMIGDGDDAESYEMPLASFKLLVEAVLGDA